MEQLYREDAYKTKFCNKYPDRIHECEYGDYCSFAHDESEIKIQLIHNYVFDADFYMFHYKTIFCPFNLTQHDKALCVYAHNWQDYRRKPDVIYYEPEPCEFWNPDGFIEDYNSACPAKEKCTKCHGWKELEFHPLVYKVNPCKNPDNCPKGSLCPLYHNEEERRFIDPKVKCSLSRYGKGSSATILETESSNIHSSTTEAQTSENPSARVYQEISTNLLEVMKSKPKVQKEVIESKIIF